MTFHGVIKSPDNVHIQYGAALHKKRVRCRERRYLIEGFRLVDQALRQGMRPAWAFYTEAFIAEERGRALAEALIAGETRVWCVSPGAMAALADTITPQGIVAILDLPQPDLSLAAQASLLLILDDLRDPGNLGTLLRTAQATGVEAVLLSPGCVDPFAPKVVRAGMGAHLALPIFPDMAWPSLAELTRTKHCVLADPRGTCSPWELDWTPPTALIVGSEAQGASPPAQALAQARVRLPMKAEVESLNAAIAGAVLLFEAWRQRQGAGSEGKGNR